MALVPGKQIETGARGVNTGNLVDGLLSADASGRAKFATDFFDSATVTAKFASAAIALDRLAEAVIQADGGQAFTGPQSMGSQKLTSLANGTDANDAVNLSQLQGLQAGLSWKGAVKAASDNAISVAYTYDNGTLGVGATITSDTNVVWDTADSDGVTLIVGDRILIKDETAGNAPYNGIYEVTDLGDVGVDPWILTRVTDMDETGEFDGGAVFVQQGATHEDQGWVQTETVTTVGTTGVSFTQFTGTGGITFGTPGSIQPDDSAAEGAASSAARSDHTHGIVCEAPDAAAQLAAAAAEGDATSFARSDHVHQANTAAAALGASAAIGTSQDIARADHVHKYLTRQVETVTCQAITGADTAMTDTLDNVPIGAVAVFLNGILQQEGAGNDFTISSQTITWLANTGTAVDQEVADEMLVIYHSA